MADPPSDEAPRAAWPLPSWKKIAEFLSNVGHIERSIETLKEQNTKLQEEVLRLQR
jgi:hypothetical protein